MINFITRCLPRNQQTQSHLANEEIRTREASILHSPNYRAPTMCQALSAGHIKVNRTW